MKDYMLTKKKIDRHIIYHIENHRLFTWIPKYTCEAGPDCSPKNIFFVIVSFDKRQKQYFTGNYSRGKSLYSKNPHDAVFFLDFEAAEEELLNSRDSKHIKLSVRKIELDFENKLPCARFVIICEDRIYGKLLFFEKVDRERSSIVTAKNSKYASRLGFRACISVMEELKSAYKKYRYSMISADTFDIDVKAEDILEFLKRNPPQKSIALSFKLRKNG